MADYFYGRAARLIKQNRKNDGFHALKGREASAIL